MAASSQDSRQVGYTKFTASQTVLVQTSNILIHNVHTGYYGSIPKEKQDQESQSKTTQQVETKQAGYVTQLDDLDSGEAIVYVEKEKRRI